MTKDGQLVIELGERAALARAVAHFKKGANTSVGSGDDAAVIRLSGPEFVVTTDTMIEGHDFRHEFSSGFDLGYKAVATNVADVYAMGARPVALVVAMTVTDKTTVFWHCSRLSCQSRRFGKQNHFQHLRAQTHTFCWAYCLQTSSCL